MLLKNLYYHKSIFTQSIIIYNINIIVILLSKLVNNIFSKTASTSTQNPQNNYFMLLSGYSIMATAFISLPVYEKEKKIKGVLNTRGVSWIGYWLGNFIFDYSVFWINLLAMGYLVVPEEVNTLGWTALAEMGIGVLLFAYCISSIFSKVKTANVWFGVINMVLSMLLMPLLLLGKTKYPLLLNCAKLLYPYFDLTVSALANQIQPEQQQIM